MSPSALDLPAIAPGSLAVLSVGNLILAREGWRSVAVVHTVSHVIDLHCGI